MSLSAAMSTNQEEAFLRDIWYFAICSDELKSGQLLSVKLLGEPVLLGRLNNGTPFADAPAFEIAKEAPRIAFAPRFVLFLRN